MRMVTIARRSLVGACRLLVGAMSLAALALAPGHAAADDSKAQAQKLFIEGLADMQKGEPAKGCAKLRESLELFAAPNTIFNVAKCDEGDGKIAAALERWKQGLALINATDPRAKVASERIDALEGRVPRLRILVPKGRVIGSVTLDGLELAPETLSAPLRVEPGKHEIVVRAPGRQDKQYTVELAERERTEVVAEPGPAEAKAQPSGSASASAGPVQPPPPPSGSGRRTAGFVAGGVGVAGFVAAAITGGLIVSRDGDIQENCPKMSCATEADRKKYVDGMTPLLVGNGIAWGVGIAGVGAGLVLILTAPSGKAEQGPATAFAPLVVEGGGGLSLSGRF